MMVLLLGCGCCEGIVVGVWLFLLMFLFKQTFCLGVVVRGEFFFVLAVVVVDFFVSEINTEGYQCVFRIEEQKTSRRPGCGWRSWRPWVKNKRFHYLIFNLFSLIYFILFFNHFLCFYLLKFKKI